MIDCLGSDGGEKRKEKRPQSIYGYNDKWGMGRKWDARRQTTMVDNDFGHTGYWCNCETYVVIDWILLNDTLKREAQGVTRRQLTRDKKAEWLKEHIEDRLTDVKNVSMPRDALIRQMIGKVNWKEVLDYMSLRE